MLPIILFILLTGCNSNISFRERYEDTKVIIRNGFGLTDDLKVHKKGSYVFFKATRSDMKYGYDYKRAAIVIKFKTEF